MKRQKAIKKEIGYINVNDLFDDLKKRATPILRKNKKPGSLLRGTDLIEPGVEMFWNDNWVRLPDNSYKTVALIDACDPGRKYRYPLNE